MRTILLALAAIAIVLPSNARAQDDTPDPVPIADWPQARITAMGQAIFDQDRAAWVATDALMKRFNNQAPQGLAGWIVVGRGGSQLVRFLRQDGGEIKPGWDVPVRNGRAGDVAVAEGALTDQEAAQFRARLTAASNIGRLRCSRQLNAVVLDDPDSDNWLVWLLTSTNDANIIPFGGHYRFTISADGGTMISRDMLSNTCMNMPRPQAGPQGRPVAMVISQVVSDGPVETHVFLSLQSRLPIYVSADDKMFEVDGARIRAVQQ